MQKNLINPQPQFFNRYIDLVEEENLIEALEKSYQVLENLDMEKLHKIGKK